MMACTASRGSTRPSSRPTCHRPGHALRRSRDRQLKTYALNAKKIHVDIDPTEINKNVPVDVALIGDLREVLAEIQPQVKKADHAEWWATINARRGDAAVRDIQSLPDSGHLYAAHVINDLWRLTQKRDTIVVTDVGQHQMWEAQYFRHEKPARSSLGRLGTMGFALRPRSAPSLPARTRTCGWSSATAASK